MKTTKQKSLKSAVSDAKKASEKRHGVIENIIEKEFNITLTDAESKELSKRAFALTQAADGIEKELAEITKQKREEIKTKWNEAVALLKSIDEGFVSRMVEVKMIKNFEAKSVQYIDTKTDKLIEERAMTADEMQMPLPLDKPKATKKREEPKPMTGAQKAYAKAERKLQKNIDAGKDDIADSIKEETNRKTKRSAVDGPSSGSGLYAGPTGTA